MAVDLGQVVDDRAVVALRPGVPLQLEGVACLDRNGSRSGLGRLVASNVAGAEGVRLDETVVLVQGQPAGSRGSRASVVPVRHRSRVRFAVDRDLLDVTVSGSGRSKSQCADGDDKGVLSERRVVHGDDLAMG